MEQNIAILMADLTGYTALTETHGFYSAADLIDKYLQLVADSLVGDCHLHSVVGDEVIVVSSSADCLLSTAIMLIQCTSNEENFLQVHGGLHYGQILKRNNNFFGTTINLVSRITNKANPGTFWCSEEYINALTDKTAFTFESRGKHNFKNISNEKEVFELVIENANAYHIDPVCRMLIKNKERAIAHPDSQHIFFCSPHCLEQYLNGNKSNPD